MACLGNVGLNVSEILDPHVHLSAAKAVSAGSEN